MLPAGQERLMGSLMKNEAILYNYVFLGATCDNFGHVQYARWRRACYSEEMSRQRKGFSCHSSTRLTRINKTGIAFTRRFRKIGIRSTQRWRNRPGNKILFSANRMVLDRSNKSPARNRCGCRSIYIDGNSNIPASRPDGKQVRRI